MKKLNKKRIEQILNSRDALSKGEDIPHDHAIDLVRWYGDELDRVVREYQARIMEISTDAIELSKNIAECYTYPK